MAMIEKKKKIKFVLREIDYADLLRKNYILEDDERHEVSEKYIKERVVLFLLFYFFCLLNKELFCYKQGTRKMTLKKKKKKH